MSVPLQDFEETAVLGCKAVREFLIYQGTNKQFYDRAKVGAVAMGSYARLRATLANETSLRLLANRVERGLLPEGKP